ncbi:TetR/AcrR family transcriptional regulator [Priestia aryabhattai]|uniref:TetR/AcrR family transcriptional regulator n=1 Tax=Priestia aryabhattai TaxID=412384 RepID=UPI002040BE3F|nr:TetR/AcrR family transcriptional regulator [Priestia aryabhattai]MCM3255693.1 TetR/AcrR family transcriptional regulator [Priestia aryabhattai]
MNKTLDPRFIRTRNLIMEAFIKLTMERDFKNIKIEDITKEATINRASFYYHFKDKYDLLEQVMDEKIQTDVIHSIDNYTPLNIDTISSIYDSIVSFLFAMTTQCRPSYREFMPTIEKILKEKLINTFDTLQGNSTSSGNVCSVMISWSLFGAIKHYINHSNYLERETYKNNVLSYIRNGMLAAY